MRMSFTDYSVFSIEHLHMRKEGKQYILGREDISLYILVSESGYEIARLLQEGKTIHQIREMLEPAFGKVNVRHYVKNLIHHGFIDKIDGKALDIEKIVHVKRLFSFIQPEWVRWLFSKPMYFLYFILFLAGLVILISTPSYFPSYKDYFFVGVYSIVVPVSFILGWTMVFIHEFAHYVAARSLGIRAKFGISNRLMYVVAITDVTNLYSVPKNQRLRVMAAGLVVDIMIMCIGLMLLFLSDKGILPLGVILYNIIKLILLIELFGIVWQTMFYLRTDIYYLFETITGVYNLSKKTKLYIKNKVFKQHFAMHYTSSKEKSVVKIYSWLVALGVFISLVMTLNYSVPILINAFSNTVKNVFTTAFTGSLNKFYDSLVFLLFYTINQSILLYALIKKFDLFRKTAFYVIMLLLFLMTNYFIIFFISLFVMNVTSNPLVMYAVMVLAGMVLGIILIKVIKKLNNISSVKIIPELFVFAVTLIYAYFLAKFSEVYLPIVEAGSIVAVSVAISYALGMAIGYLWHFEKSVKGF